MRVLVACEYSGTVRDAFKALGHDAMSCDILPTERPGKHYQGDVLSILGDGWDLMIAHPPCTHIAVSGAAWFKEKRADGRQQQGIDFFMAMINAPIPKICVENPICIMSSKYRKPDQIIHPWMFGQEFSKPTCLWLKGLPILFPTSIVGKGEFVTTKTGRRGAKWNYWLPPGPERGKIRSKTFQGIADAMAKQWGTSAAYEKGREHGRP
jgi:hypothetical protein